MPGKENGRHYTHEGWRPLLCWRLTVALVVNKAAQVIGAGRVAQFAQGLGFDLTDTLPGYVELFADFFQGVVGVHFNTETHAQYFRFASGQAGQHGAGCLAQAFSRGGIHRRQGLDIFDEIAQMAVFIVANRGFHGDRLFGDLQYLADLVFRHFHALAKLFRRGLAAHFLQHLTRDAVELVDGLNHMHRNPDGAGLVRNRAGDGLTNPPGGVGREFVATTVLKLVHRLHQADVAFLDQVQELQAAVGVFLGDGNNQAQVGLDHFFLGTAGLGFADRNATVDFLDVDHGQVHFGLHVLDAFLQAYDFVNALADGSGVWLLGGGDFFRPLKVDFVAREPLDKVFAGHFAVAYTDLHDRPLVLTHQVVGGANHVHQFVKRFVGQFERSENLV